MLVLTRKPGESVVIGDDIEVTVVSVEKNAVRLSIQAPRSVSVYRRELWDDIKRENLEALQAAARLEERLQELDFPSPASREFSGEEGKEENREEE